mgnify:CR=1 FL=1
MSEFSILKTCHSRLDRESFSEDPRWSLSRALTRDEDDIGKY